MAHVYFLHAEDFKTQKKHAIKIGCTSNLQKRIISLQIGNHKDISLWKSIEFNTLKEAESVEKIIHTWLFSYLIRGEWFQCHSVVYAVLNNILDRGMEQATKDMQVALPFIRKFYKNEKFENIDFEHETIIYGDGGYDFRIIPGMCL